ncbi:MAG: hypothetical protein HFI89_14655 [Lachnospiraceae bacterium]|nr:hypothetical protein [Lachnospiraceae bacterium]
MTEKDLRRLRRQDLLQLLVEQSKEAARLQAESEGKSEELAQLNESCERLKGKLDEKDVQLERLKEKLNEKDAVLEKLKERLNEKDALLEKLKGRLDEKDALIGDLEKRLEVLQSDRWEKLDSDGMVTDIIAKHLKAALFEPEKSEGIESDGRDVHEREQREEA